jgi:hypothetical protein
METGSAPPEGRRTRVRWGNVGRAAALLAIAALVVAWPHLRAPVPELPAGNVAPAARVPAAPAAPEPEPVATRPTPVPEVRERRPESVAPPRRTKRRRAARRRAPPGRSSPSRQAPAPILRGPPAPAQTEFGVE